MKSLIPVIIICFTVLAGCQSKEKETQNTPAADSSARQTVTPKDTSGSEPADSNEAVVKVHYYENGAVETETEYVNGVRNGMHKLYDEQGRLISEVKYVNNKMEGTMKTYYEDGKIKVTVPYEHGLVSGEMVVYYPDGKIFKKQLYDKGKLLSTKQYKPDGTLEFEDKP